MEQLKKFVDKYFVLLETVLTISFAAALLLILYEFKYYKAAINTTTILLAFLYFLKGMIKQEDMPSVLELLSFRLQWYSLSIIILGIAYKLTLNEDNQLLIAGFVINLISLILITFLFVKKKYKFTAEYYIRSLVFFLVGGLVFIF